MLQVEIVGCCCSAKQQRKTMGEPVASLLVTLVIAGTECVDATRARRW